MSTIHNSSDKLLISSTTPYYIIPGLELDVEADYASVEEQAEGIREIEQLIEARSIPQAIGSSEVNSDDVIYVPASGEIVYADCFMILPF